MTVPTSNFEPAFDPDCISELWGDLSDETFVTVLGVFADDVGPLCRQAIAAAREGNSETLVRVAHTLRGAAANVCATNLAMCAGRIEGAAQSCRIEEIDRLIADLEGAYAAIKLALFARGITTDDR